MAKSPFNSLGQILQAGGEVTIAKAMAEGWSTLRIDNYIDRKYPRLSQQDRLVLMQIAARSFQQAPFAYQSMALGGNAIEDIPIIPGLFGSESGGRRARYGLEHSPPMGEGRVFTVLETPDVLTLEQLAIELAQYLDVAVGNSPDFLVNRGVPRVDPSKIMPITVGRSF